MKLVEIRRAAIRKQIRVRFQLPDGLECTITEHGVASIPALKAKAEFNLEDALGSVEQFQVEPVTFDGSRPRVQKMSASELEKLLAQSIGVAASAADHDE